MKVFKEWTELLITFLRDTLIKLGDYYTTTRDVQMIAEFEKALKSWQYCSRLAKYMDEVIIKATHKSTRKQLI